MMFLAELLVFLLAGLIALPAVHARHLDNSTLYVTAIVGKNNISTTECWALNPGFVAVDSRVS